MSMWRPLFLKCMILDQKLQRMLNDSKIAQLNSERPLHQTAVRWESSTSCRNYNTSNCLIHIYCKQKSSHEQFRNLKIMEKELFRVSRSFVSLDIEMLNDLNSSGFNLFFGLVLTTPPPLSVKTNMNTQNIIILTRNFVTRCAKSIFKSESHMYLASTTLWALLNLASSQTRATSMKSWLRL